MIHYVLIVVVVISLISWTFIIWKLLGRQKKYFGSIVVTENDGITLFSLELKGNPEEILNHKDVTFKVEIPEEESDRK